MLPLSDSPQKRPEMEKEIQMDFADVTITTEPTDTAEDPECSLEKIFDDSDPIIEPTVEEPS